jgi:selenocysteine-specific elongation factor
MVLASPGLLLTSSRMDVKLSLLPSAKSLKTGSRVHLHAFSSEVIATVSLLDRKQLQPGSEAFAQLHLSAPLLLVPGDRFIIRQFSPVVTIGGGVVLDLFPLRKMPAAQRVEFLATLSSGDATAKLLARIQRRAEAGISLRQLTIETGLSHAVLDPVLAGLEREQKVTRKHDLLLDAAAFGRLKAMLVQSVTEFHAKNPLVPGISRESLREQAGLSPQTFEAGLDFCVSQKTLAITGDLVHLPGGGVVMKDEESESRRVIEQAFASAGLKVPALKDVLAGLKIDRNRAQKIMTLLLRDKTLIKISDDLVFHRIALDDLREKIIGLKQTSPKIDVSRFKDLTGVSRKYAIPLLEYLDRERVTRRIGDERMIL